MFFKHSGPSSHLPSPCVPFFISSCFPVLLSHDSLPVSRLPVCFPSPCLSHCRLSPVNLSLCLPVSHLSVYLSPCLSVSLSPCLPVSMSICLSVSLSPCLYIFLFPCFPVSLSSYLPAFLSHVPIPVTRLPACLQSPCMSA